MVLQRVRKPPPLQLVVVAVTVIVVVAVVAAVLSLWGDRLQILPILNLVDNISKFYIVTMFIILNLEPVFQTQFVEVFILFLYTGFHTHSSTDPSVTVVMPQAQ
jgi:hypothetical protein